MGIFNESEFEEKEVQLMTVSYRTSKAHKKLLDVLGMTNEEAEEKPIEA